MTQSRSYLYQWYACRPIGEVSSKEYQATRVPDCEAIQLATIIYDDSPGRVNRWNYQARMAPNLQNHHQQEFLGCRFSGIPAIDQIDSRLLY